MDLTINYKIKKESDWSVDGIESNNFNKWGSLTFIRVVRENNLKMNKTPFGGQPGPTSSHFDPLHPDTVI